MASQSPPVTPVPYQSRVAAEVRAELHRRNIAAEHVVAATGISRGTMSRRLNGLLPFTVDELAAIAAMLGVEPSMFLPKLEAA